MAKEKPVLLKKRKHLKPSSRRQCVIHSTNFSEYGDVKQFTDYGWEKVCEVKALRMDSEEPNNKLVHICEQIPVLLDKAHHGYHRPCYQKFTNLYFLKKRAGDEQEPTCSQRKKRAVGTSCSTGPLFSKDSCLFCDKKTKYINRKKEILVKCSTHAAKESIKEAANEKDDGRIKGITDNYCLIAKEAHYHEACRRAYIRKTERHEATCNETALQSEKAHSAAFGYIQEYVKKYIINNSQVERMTMLTEKYCLYLQRHHPDVYNPNYKTYKLKDKLQKAFGSKLQFWQPNYRSELVYSSEVPKGCAIETAFESASSDERRIEEAALVLRRLILDKFKDAPEIPWPPSADYLLSNQIEIPTLLDRFLRNLFSKRTSSNAYSIRCDRLVQSIGQDICYNVTAGQWKMPKQLLLGMTVRHITGNTQLIKILNRFGHCASHSVLLELETAMCDAVVQSPTKLPAGITKQANIVTQFCWDNFDLNEETPSGKGTTHSTHGIIIQEIGKQIEEGDIEEGNMSAVDDDNTSECVMQNELEQKKSQTKRSKKRSAIYSPVELQPCYVGSKVEPDLEVKETKYIQTTSENNILKADFLWVFCRFKLNESKCTFPSWKGWLSATQESQEKTKSLVDYMAPINASINENSTVQAVLQISQEATHEVEQEYTFVTFDLAVAKKAYALVWNSAENYKNVFIHLGVFHTMMSYLSALGKLIKGSGFEEIITEAGICASGSLEKVLNGKHYNRALRVHSIVLESLERMLITTFEQNKGSGRLSEKLLIEAKQLATTLDNTTTERVLTSQACVELFAEYEYFKEQVRLGQHGKTAQFWIQYMDRVWLLLRFLRATKTNNLDLHISCLQQLCPLMFSMDHHNYARYLSVYFISLLNLPHSHPGAESLLRSNGFSVCRSNVPAARTAVDLTIEQTINRHAKTRGGIVGFSRSVPAYYRWAVTRHNRASYVSATHEMADLSDSSNDSHKELTPARKLQSENAIQETVKAFAAFINPFEVQGDLVCLSSGLKVSEDVANDLLKAEEIGRASFESFVNSTLKTKSLSFHERLKRNNLKSFTSLSKVVSVKPSGRKEIKIKNQRNLFGQLLILSQTHNIDLEKVLTYPLSPVPWSLSTPDGLPLKTNKSTLLHKLEDKCPSQMPADLTEQNKVHIVDGNALLQSLTDLPNTFGDLAKRVFAALPVSKIVHFVTDTYQQGSIKSAERLRRGSAEVTTYLVRGSSTKLPRDWKKFLSSDDNKTSLISLLLSEWESDDYAEKLKNREVIFVSQERCISLSSSDGITTFSIPVQELFSSQEEADTRIVLHSIYASQQANCDAVVVRSPDTDVFLLLLSFKKLINKPLIFDTGTGNKRRQIDIGVLSEKIGKDMTDALLGLHAFTGCDSTSCFARKGKIRALSMLEKDSELVDLFVRFGTSEILPDNDKSQLETFVCKLYGKPSYTNINRVRYDIVRQRFRSGTKSPLSTTGGTDLNQMPPCKMVLLLHMQRANFQTLIWRESFKPFPILPKPENNGWEFDSTGFLVVKWYNDEFLPAELLDIITEEICTVSNEDDDDSDDGTGTEEEDETECGLTDYSTDEMTYSEDDQEVQNDDF